MKLFDQKDARSLLEKAGVFIEPDDDGPDTSQVLNMSDVWAWGCADGEEVPDEELPRVAELFFRYGWCGILYWASERRGGVVSEFCDNNRFVEFVRAEEKLREEVPDDTKRAYTPRKQFQYDPLPNLTKDEKRQFCKRMKSIMDAMVKDFREQLAKREYGEAEREHRE